jgi:polyphosphate kinase
MTPSEAPSPHGHGAASPAPATPQAPTPDRAASAKQAAARKEWLDSIGLDSRELFINREQSWLRFNARVLEEARSGHNPLLERVMFLSIASNNLDEFFMKRVGGLKRQLAAGVTRLSPDGMTPMQQLLASREAVLEMIADLSRLLLDDLIPDLREKGVHLVSLGDLTERQRAWLDEHFEKFILPVLTPLGVGPGQPFPFISNLSLSLAVRVTRPGQDAVRFARVKIPSNRPRFLKVADEMVFVRVEEVIAANIQRLFPGMEILEAAAFRVTRNADMERNEEEADDLLEIIEEELRNRRFAPIVRLEANDAISEELLAWLVGELGIDGELDVYLTDAPLGLLNLTEIARLDVPKLHFKPHSPVSPPRLRALEAAPDGVDIFSIIRSGDILLHHPFQSFATTVLALLQSAAADPKVVAIKQTLYRTAENSSIVGSILRAAENGKEVNVQIEIKARFDEMRNIEWVRKLESAGVHVAYGFVGLKTHCKTLMIVREEPEGLRRYCHLGTGNYHAGTARLYTDIGLLTCDPEICQDVADLFNYLTGHSDFRDYRKLLVAPLNMRKRFLEMIQREIDLSTPDNPGRIFAKMNQLEDSEIIEALYRASRAGVKIDLIVRGFCCLRPGVPGLSDNIRVRTILGRYLEHSRICNFKNGGQEEYYIGSADWMSRNLDWRVESVVPIQDPVLQKELRYILRTAWADHAQSWELQPDGHYARRRPRRGDGSQQAFMDRYARLSAGR